VKVEFIIRTSTPHHLEEFQRRRFVTIDETTIWIVAPEDLVISTRRHMTEWPGDWCWPVCPRPYAKTRQSGRPRCCAVSTGVTWTLPSFERSSPR
jgi:hypothetical protein